MVSDRLEVLNPVAALPTETQRVPPVPRLSTLEGRRVGLYWNYKPGGNFALERVGEMLKERYKNIRVQMYPAPRPVPQKVLEEVRSECDVVIGSTAD